MKTCCLIFVLVVALALAEAARIRRDDEKYTSKYDTINIDEILRNDRLINNYADCIMERGKCNPEGAELKKHITDALQNDCAKCTETQKTGSKKVIEYLYKNKRELWGELEKKYDPEGTYVKKYEAELKEAAA